MKKDTIEIPLSKKKMMLKLLGSILFCCIGLWLIIKQPVSSNLFLSNPIVTLLIGCISILFFGIITISILNKFRNSNIGLTINAEGIIDNTSGISGGLILWKDIIDIQKTTVVNQQFLKIITNNPQLYIDKQKSVFKKKAMLLNYKSYGSPIFISANTLQINFDTLYETVLEKYLFYKS
ncbi:hypothetical protein FIA58_001285 [Flavobacterium jejuense]|uniref:GRAM domain-containing protein n=1 Tax=Flavobacterium jejuense TaxID=1544455 RepID=A0ABX0IQX6_9FLAO|nr:STM3941 family protein [Flavobacterium jejuense]NHN24294.1 hypothetical protein [Flavobacterium jejuense]